MKTKIRIFLPPALILLSVLVWVARAEPEAPRANKDASEPVISADGRFVAFVSAASDLVPDDTNYDIDVFVYDRQTGETTLISRDPNGVPGNSRSFYPSISGDGRYVAFATWADNLLADHSSAGDVLVHDRQTGETTLVSRSSDGTPANFRASSPSISTDGRYVAFSSEADNLVEGDTQICDEQWGTWDNCSDIFVHDLQTGETTLISRNAGGIAGNGDSWSPSISADGRYVAFESYAINLLDGIPIDPAGQHDDGQIYVHDRQTGQTALASVNSDGVPADAGGRFPSISGDGQRVAFYSTATNLGPATPDAYVFVHDMQTGETTPVSHNTGGLRSGGSFWFAPVISADGRSVAFIDRVTDPVSGSPGNAEQIFVYDLESGETALVSRHQNGTPGDGPSSYPAISGDGRLIAFQTYATNLTGGSQIDVFSDIALHDRETGETTLLTTRPDTLQGNSESQDGAVSADGRFVVFESYANNLVPGDNNGQWDIFVRDMQTGETARIGRDGQATGQSRDPAISADGRFVVFGSTPEPGGNREWYFDVFLFDRQTGETTLITRSISEEGRFSHTAQNPTISADGRYIAFDSMADDLAAGDPKEARDIFVYDRQTDEMTWVPPGKVDGKDWGGPCCASLSAGGRYVAFTALLVYEVSRLGIDPGPWHQVLHVFLYDRTEDTLTLVSHVNRIPYSSEGSDAPSISADGRYVAFHSTVTTFVPDDKNAASDIFVYDRETEEIELLSRHTNGEQGRYNSLYPTISADGRYVTFQSDADNLVDDDDNERPDIFIHDRETGETVLVSRGKDGKPGRGNSLEPSIAAGGGHVAFWSDAGLVPGDVNGYFDIFLYDRTTEQTSLVSGVILGPYRTFNPVVIR